MVVGNHFLKAIQKEQIAETTRIMPSWPNRLMQINDSSSVLVSGKASFGTPTMKTEKIENLDVGTVTAVIARSQIVVHRHGTTHEAIVGQLPAAFDEVDVIVLVWIAADVRAAGYCCPN